MPPTNLRTHIIRAALVAVLGLCASRSVLAQQTDPELLKRIAAIEENQRELMRQIQEIKALIQGAQSRPPAGPPPSLDLSIDEAASKGRADARLTMVEFSDFQCPFCGRFVHDTLPQLLREYVDTGKVRLVFRHFPIPSLHPDATRASEAGECARQQGKFWEMHDKLFANQQALSPAALIGYGSAIGLDAARFQSCLGGMATAQVRQDVDVGTRIGISGTPTFFIGTMQNGKVHVLRAVVGASPYANFKTALDELLK